MERLKNIPTAGKPSDAPLLPSSSSGGSGGGSGHGAGGVGSGRRSRRNSVDENASQLSVENLGGSQQNLSLLGNPPAVYSKTYIASAPIF